MRCRTANELLKAFNHVQLYGHQLWLPIYCHHGTADKLASIQARFWPNFLTWLHSSNNWCSLKQSITRQATCWRCAFVCYKSIERRYVSFTCSERRRLRVLCVLVSKLKTGLLMPNSKEIQFSSILDNEVAYRAGFWNQSTRFRPRIDSEPHRQHICLRHFVLSRVIMVSRTIVGTYYSFWNRIC